MQLINGTYAPDHPDRFRPLYDLLLSRQGGSPADRYFVLKDFESYADAQRRIVAAYEDKKNWARMAILNTASTGKFTSDRTIQEYVDDIWHLSKVDINAAPAKKSRRKSTK